jgi:exonuclease VII large subunit
MADFEVKSRYHLYINQDTLERMKEIEDHLKDNYDGISDFVEQKMQEEQALSLEERIKRKRQNLEKQKKELNQLEQVKNDRETQDKLRDKRELLKEKQRKLREIQEKGVNTEHVLLREKALAAVNRGYDISSDRAQSIVREQVDRELEERPDLDELVESVQRLQRQVAELNGGEESYFMDLGELEVQR